MIADVTWLQWVGSALMILGSGLFAVAGLGVLRMPDVYARASALAAAAGMGLSLLLLGVWCWVPGSGNFVKLLAAILLMLLTSSIGSIAVARAAYLTGSRMDIGGVKQRVTVDKANGEVMRARRRRHRRHKKSR